MYVPRWLGSGSCLRAVTFTSLHFHLLRSAAEARGNKLRGNEYDATTWSARTWMGFVAQRISCTLARAVAWELASAMELTRVRDARDD